MTCTVCFSQQRPVKRETLKNKQPYLPWESPQLNVLTFNFSILCFQLLSKGKSTTLLGLLFCRKKWDRYLALEGREVRNPNQRRRNWLKVPKFKMWLKAHFSFLTVTYFLYYISPHILYSATDFKTCGQLQNLYVLSHASTAWFAYARSVRRCLLNRRSSAYVEHNTSPLSSKKKHYLFWLCESFI